MGKLILSIGVAAVLVIINLFIAGLAHEVSVTKKNVAANRRALTYVCSNAEVIKNLTIGAIAVVAKSYVDDKKNRPIAAAADLKFIQAYQSELKVVEANGACKELQ